MKFETTRRDVVMSSLCDVSLNRGVTGLNLPNRGLWLWRQLNIYTYHVTLFLKIEEWCRTAVDEAFWGFMPDRLFVFGGNRAAQLQAAVATGPFIS